MAEESAIQQMCSEECHRLRAENRDLQRKLHHQEISKRHNKVYHPQRSYSTVKKTEYSDFDQTFREPSKKYNTENYNTISHSGNYQQKSSLKISKRGLHNIGI